MIEARPFGVVYLHYNPVSEKGYVGQTMQGMEKRWKLHLKCARSKKTPASRGLVAKAIRKYGADTFEHQVLSMARSQSELDNLEKIWIILLQTKVPNGYNLTDGGDSGTAGHVVTPEVRAVLSAKGKANWADPVYRAEHTEINSRLRKGKSQTDEVIAKRVAKMLGRKASSEEIAKRVAKTTGMKRTQEFRDACAARMTGIKRSDETRLRMSLAQKARQERGRTNGEKTESI